jgi:hypothetical protein
MTRARPRHVLLAMLFLVGSIAVGHAFVLWFMRPAIRTRRLAVGSFLAFATPRNSASLRFEISANGGRARDSLAKYCNATLCAVPLVFGGEQSLSLFAGDRLHTRFAIASGENRFHCVNGDWRRRICRFRDVCLDGGGLSLLSPYPIESAAPLLVLGARPPPYDRKRDRVHSVRVSVSRATAPRGRTVNAGTTIYAAPFHNSHMLWHFLFDFALPLFHTALLFRVARPAVVVPAGGHFPPASVLKAFTESYRVARSGECYRDLIVGISKVKDAVNGTLYEFPANFTHRLHPRVLEHYGIAPPARGRPVMLFVQREAGSRVITNFNQSLALLRAEFPGFDVRPAVFERMAIPDQIAMVHSAEVLIGAHGSGLANLAWMRPGTTLVEIFPLHFECRDWYQRAAVVSAVRYARYVPADASESPGASEAARNCWGQRDPCGEKCVTYVRDQNIRLNVSAFLATVAAAIAN